ncbi:hypothetical protein ACIPSE_39245 [Streptomyces sp. NPDC090106]|uniref:hypothetical protein n=1 Tax=Streptomyces sp. NPDC090106 TaxID=3365946 RepID=UPI00380C97C9
MVSLTHTRLRLAKSRRPARRHIAAAEQPSLGEAHPEQHDLPTQAQVWNWTESAVLGGYGPAASSFL